MERQIHKHISTLVTNSILNSWVYCNKMWSSKVHVKLVFTHCSYLCHAIGMVKEGFFSH